jgi:8-oxo-dGTP diphosphatase
MKQCPKCGEEVPVFRNPVPTVDIVIEVPGRGIVLIERRNPPLGWALPGGFVDYGESFDQAAVREAREETGLEVTLTAMLGVYSRPDRDPRQHTASTVFVAEAETPQDLEGADDASRAGVFQPGEWPSLAFDHERILQDYLKWKEQSGPRGEVGFGRAVCFRGQRSEGR